MGAVIAKIADRKAPALWLAAHLELEHGIPSSVAATLTYDQALQLCADDQAQELEDAREVTVGMIYAALIILAIAGMRWAL